MTQLRDKFNINDEDSQEQALLKSLPNDFKSDDDEINGKRSLLISFLLHPAFILVVSFCIACMMNLGMFDKPNLKKRDITFVLTHKEAPPIDKNTKNRSDKNSQAGGKNDPKRAESAPKAPSPEIKKSTPAPKKQVQKQVAKPTPAPKPVQKTTPKPVQKATPKPVVQTPAPKAPAKPTPVKAPSVNYKPALSAPSLPKAQMPKLAQTPKSPFSIAVPKSTAPVGPVPTYGSKTSASSASSSSASSSSGSSGPSMPAPQFSASKSSSSSSSSSSASSASSPSSRYSQGNLGNPSPSNPKGAPGIDAIKQPNWGPYMRDLESRIKRNWNPPKGNQSKRVVLLFTIGRDGRLLKIRTVSSSNQPLSDQAAKSAVELTAPFRPLPPEFRGSSVDIEFTFDYNVLNATGYR